ncbi:uncharacterized protein B0I36DRAFT_384979 [Microdochium trichocladiopsis]|uniref:NmrA-like domain-containing protein n=1 Tax=Microdochium trichocladiopsis TaxID=1682393 RepID=A0A9P8Y537_9PEZI|nr:uncharacterized protein B0I36DRAFT_384979 [Microdochium trichocladiopsis]KAH7029480.1 hypothetical protein B0I36DRAFT_384979 [Microdochium trichocladiopsis]
MPKAFVTAATGSQGSALCRLLLSKPSASPSSGAAEPWTVVSTTRNTSSPAAIALAELGVGLTQAEWDNTPALEAAIQGCTHLFLNLMPNLKTMESELPLAEKILDIAGRSGVKHIIYSSAYTGNDDKKDKPKDKATNGDDGDDDDNSSPIAKLMNALHDGKYAIEKLVLSYAHAQNTTTTTTTSTSSIQTATVLRPGFFQLNFLLPRVSMMYPALPSTRVWTTALRADTPIPMVDVRDIARLAALVFDQPARFNGKVLPVWGELLIPGQIMAELGAAVAELEKEQGSTGTKGSRGAEFKAEFLTDEQVAERKPTDLFANVQLLMRGMGRAAAEVHPPPSYGVEMTSFREFLAAERELVKKTYLP